MRLSQKTEYALCGLFDLAYHNAGAPLQVRVIGERQRIPPRYLEQIFSRLRRAELVRAKRGRGGGYVLARPADEISLREVVEAIEGPLADTLGSGPPPRRERGARGVRERPNFLWPLLASRCAQSFDGLTLAELCRRAARGAVPRACGGTRTWEI